MNSRGQLGDMLVVFAFIFLIGIVGGGIVIGTLIFIGNGYDFRESDAGLLGAKIESCANDGFNISLLGSASDKIVLLSEKCHFDKTLLENYYKIKICDRKVAKNSSECIKSSNSILVFGDVEPCEATESTKFLGCSRRVTNDYIIVTATNQQLRRNAK